MPHTNRITGAVIMGVGGGPMSINGTRRSPSWGGSACWFGPSHAVYRSNGGVTLFDVETSTEIVVSPRHAWLVAACANLLWIASDDVGVFGPGIEHPGYSLGLHGNDQRGAIAPDGTYAIVKHGGRGFELWNDGTRTYENKTEIAYDIQVLGPMRAIWRSANGTLYSLGVDLGPVEQRVPMAEPIYVETPLGPWIVGFCGAIGLVAHPIGQADAGVIIAGAGVDTYYPDATWMDAAGLSVVWSSGAGELPNDLRIASHVEQLPRVDLLKQLTPIPVEPIVPIGRRCWLGWFEFTNALAFAPPANCYLWVRQGGMIATEHAAIGQWIQRDPDEPEDVTVIEHKAALSGLPAVVYWDAREWPRFPTLPANATLCLQWYCRAHETPAQFEAEMRRVLDSVPANYPRIAGVCQCYTSNPGLTTNLTALVPVYARLARDYPRVSMLLVFSDQGRPTGLNDHPEVRPHWQALFAGITGIPGGEMDNGIVDGVLVDPEKWFRWLVQERSPADYPQVLAEIEPELFKYGFGQQTDGSGTVLRGRLFVPWAGCRNAAPRAGEPLDAKYHVNQTPACCGIGNVPHAFVNVVNDPPTAWIWDYHGEPYVPIGPIVDPEPTPAPVAVLVLAYDTHVRRSDPHGMLIRFEAASDRPVIRATIQLNDGGPIYTLRPPEGTADVRYWRGLSFKPVISGTWQFTIEIENDQGAIARTDGSHTVTVVE